MSIMADGGMTRLNPERGALSQLGALRRRLAATDAAFSAAAQIEHEAEIFCDRVRTDLKAHRLALGLNQKELAERIDVSQSAISKLEGGRGDLSLRIVFRIAEALGLRPVMDFASAAPHAAAEAPAPVAAVAARAAAVARAVQEDLRRKIPDIVQEAIAREESEAVARAASAD
jgi:transcriptional regulator with XRE-family HTH domain